MRQVGTFAVAAALLLPSGISSAAGLDEWAAPCALLSTATAPTTLFRTGGAAACAASEGRDTKVMLVVRQFDPAARTEEIARMRRGVALGSYREVDGYGERAFVLERGATTVLCIFDGRRYLQVSVQGSGSRQNNRHTAERLAREALARLGAAHDVQVAALRHGR